MDISSPSNWVGPYEYNKPNPNAPILIPLTFSATMVAVNVSITANEPTWFTGGWLRQIVQINLNAQSNSWTTFSQRLRLGGNIIVFPVDYASYQLQFSFPIWFKDGVVSLWIYKGS